MEDNTVLQLVGQLREKVNRNERAIRGKFIEVELLIQETNNEAMKLCRVVEEALNTGGVSRKKFCRADLRRRNNEPQPGPCNSGRSRSTDSTRKHGAKLKDSLNNRFICHCDELFNNYAKLKRHIVEKTDGKKHKCPLFDCNSKFVFGEELTKHCKMIHRINIFSCNNCLAQFGSKSERQRHYNDKSECSLDRKRKRRNRLPLNPLIAEGTAGAPSVREPEPEAFGQNDDEEDDDVEDDDDDDDDTSEQD